jgi:lysophospholipase L1-like esterase
MTYKRYAAALLVALPLLTSCKSDEKLNSPVVADKMFRRYVSMGNSLTAGFQSAGISDSTQQRAYPVLLAKAMGAPFSYPRLNGLGCPPPWVLNLPPFPRVGGDTLTTCGIPPRSTIVPPLPPISNVAFPGAVVAELLNNFGDDPSPTDVYKTLLLGGRTQAELLRSLKPTFVSIWIGANDVLDALLATNPGDPTKVTDPTAFAASYDSVLDAVHAEGARAILLSVPNVTVSPYASSAAIWYCLKNGGCPAPLPPQNPLFASLVTFTVNVNCAPPAGVPVLVPWGTGLTKLATAVAGAPASIDCSVDNEVSTAAETANMVAAVAAYNAHIAQEATARGYAYLDVNPALLALVADGTIPSFPDFIPALSGQSVDFGPMFSLDGFHISSTAHRLVADSVASTINQFYGTSLPVPVCGTVSCPAP